MTPRTGRIAGGRHTRVNDMTVVPNRRFIHSSPFGRGLLSHPRTIFAHMFERTRPGTTALPEIEDLASLSDAELIAAGVGWARAENAAAARKLAVMAELFARRTGLAAGEREDWFVDPAAELTAELAAAHGISQGLAMAQTHRAVALRDRLPEVAALFAAGRISDLMVRTIVWRTHLIVDAEALARVDAAVATCATDWGALSKKKAEQAVDALVELYDPGALRRARTADRSRDVVIGSPADEPGITNMWGRLSAPDAAALKKRLTAMARSVCLEDPRTLAERRADALGALADGLDLVCECGADDCPAVRNGAPEQKPTPDTVIYVIAESGTVDAASQAPVDDDGQAAVDDEGAEPPAAPPAFIVGHGVLPAPLLGPLLDRARLCPLRHPGSAPPEPRYRPSAALEAFVRCRDLTCRFPGCDRPADVCDVDHTVPYPDGPTHASNLKCLCRFHHLLKTFWAGWKDCQLPDGTVIWTSPTGQTHTTKPGSALHFPSLCAPTGTLNPPDTTSASTAGASTAGRDVKMPKRRRTRDEDRAYRIEAERRLNADLVAERNRPPPF